ncbi:MAG: hypothetical protein LBU29_01405 [Endomicrobium sp.]|jgi:hypothetical protein|nr:hypothetical protein [Endomicrobium sp.]
MTETEKQLGMFISSSTLGKYEMVKFTLLWISANKYNDEYKKLTPTELMIKGLHDVETNVATFEKIEELCKKVKKEVKPESEKAKK